MQENNERHEKPSVMVRAWGDEPITLKLHRIENNRCYVGIERAERPIGLPVDQVFALDVDRLTLLSTAFQQGDRHKLGELLANIPVDDFACNKYRDILESPHDQEHITDTECASGRNSQ
jgi:hypothetical protein